MRFLLQYVGFGVARGSGSTPRRARRRRGPWSATACSSATTGRSCEPVLDVAVLGGPTPGPFAYRSSRAKQYPVPRADSAASLSSMKTT